MSVCLLCASGYAPPGGVLIDERFWEGNTGKLSIGFAPCSLFCYLFTNEVGDFLPALNPPIYE